MAQDTKKPTLTTRKSVDFTILPPPAKRVRGNNSVWSAKHVVDAISTSVTPQERLEAVQKAKDSFLHDIQAAHDEEMALGADAALTKHLTFLVFSSTSPPSASLTNEIALTLDAMESLYRASSHIVDNSFQRMGHHVLHLLNLILHQQLQGRSDDSAASTFASSFNQDDVPDRLLRKLTKILGHFARVGDATHPMAQFPGLLTNLLTLVGRQPYTSIPWEARLSSLWILANLACNTENMVMMVQTPGLMDALIDVAQRSVKADDPIEHLVEVLRSRSICARAILNLSWDTGNKVTLAENTRCVGLLVDLLSFPRDFTNSQTVHEILVATRRHAAGALRNVAAAPRRTKIALCEFENGRILDALTETALNDSDAHVQDRAYACVHNLSIQDTAELIANRPALVVALKNVLLSQDKASGDTPKSHASATLLVLERTITPSMHSFGSVRSLLDAVQNHKANEGATAAAVTAV